MREFPAVLALVLLASCNRSPPLARAQAEPKLDPSSFFTGRSSGEATLDILVLGKTPVWVESRGLRRADGAVVLDQRIAQFDKPDRLRRWVIRPAGPGRWSGSLTDAAGPVTIRAQGNAATIDFTAKDGVAIHQDLRLRADRNTLDNRLTATKWGVQVATLSEVIRKLD
ncbi:MAG: DUF3833 family protein [Sphingomonas sp.]|nr:DUF3833 family protein [Sphingomonas sp.]